MSTLTLARNQSDILSSLRRLGGRGTVGDVMASSGLAGDTVRDTLKELLESHRGHLEVSDSGELLYQFDPGLIERGSEPLLARASRKANTILTRLFKGWIVVTLVVYFVVFVALAIAALLASQRGNDSRGGWGRSRRHGFDFGDMLFWYWIWSPRWRLDRPYYGHRWERTLAKKDRVPFYRKVFAFVFGPDRPKATQKQIDRGTLRLIRARNGVLTTAELVQYTGTSFDEAEQEMARLLGAYDGEAAASPDGEIVYAFPGIMASAQGHGGGRAPNPAWLRLEYPRELTGNTSGANALVAGINGFNLLVAATAPWFLFPRLGLGGPAAFIGLVVVPLVFSILFFSVPMLRMIGVRIDNRRRAVRNVRRVLLGLVYRRSLEGDRYLGVAEAQQYVATRLKEQGVERGTVEAELRSLAEELEADVSVDDAGETSYRFSGIKDQFAASETVRKVLALESRSLGEIVFSTADDAEQADTRDLALFDRTLSQDELNLDRYLPAADRIDFEEDFEVVAFEDELRAAAR